MGAVRLMLPAPVSAAFMPVYGASLLAAVLSLLAERRLRKGCSSRIVGALPGQKSCCAWPLLLPSSGGVRIGQVSIANREKACVNYFHRVGSKLQKQERRLAKWESTETTELFAGSPAQIGGARAANALPDQLEAEAVPERSPSSTASSMKTAYDNAIAGNITDEVLGSHYLSGGPYYRQYLLELDQTPVGSPPAPQVGFAALAKASSADPKTQSEAYASDETGWRASEKKEVVNHESNGSWVLK